MLISAVSPSKMTVLQSAVVSMEELARACEPSLKTLLQEFKTKQLVLPLEEATARAQADEIFRN